MDSATHELVAISPVMISVTNYPEVAQVGRAFRAGAVVDMVLTGASVEVLRRSIDFAAGLTFGGGTVARVADRRYRLTPR